MRPFDLPCTLAVLALAGSSSPASMQEAYLKASNTEAHDAFASALDVSGGTLVVGAPFEDSGAHVVDGDQSDNSKPDSGAAYVFVRSGTTWTQEAYLKAANPDSGDRFGTSVAIFGDTIVVGAQGESSSATGVDGNGNENSAALSGAAYVYVRSGSNWSLEAYLKASNTESMDLFGNSVAIDGGTVVVAARNEDGGSMGVGGDPSDNSATNSGAAYVFVRSGTTWVQQAYLKRLETDLRLSDVAISGDAIAIRGPSSVTVFERTGVDWNGKATIHPTSGTSSSIEDHAISGATLVFGTPYDDSGPGEWAGSVHIFARSGTTWSQEAWLQRTPTVPEDTFGHSVDILGNTILVGATEERAWTATPGPGRAHAFTRAGTVWTQIQTIEARTGEHQDRFGGVVRLSDGEGVVGTHLEDSNATGIDGDGSDNTATDSGAGYSFPIPSLRFYCTAGTTSSGCNAALSSAGLPSATATTGFTIAVGNAEGLRNGVFFYGISGPAALPWGMGAMWSGSWLCVRTPIQRAASGFTTGNLGFCNGAMSFDWNELLATGTGLLGQPRQPGATFHAQFWSRDPGNGPGVPTTSLSNALEFVLRP